MEIFVDTSALYALMDERDPHHGAAVRQWRIWGDDAGLSDLLTSNYVLLEAGALIQNRLGLQATRDFHYVVRPALRVVWIDSVIHDSAVAYLLAADRRALSLVDCTCFQIMHRLSLEMVFAFDRHFADQGFIVLPQEP